MNFPKRPQGADNLKIIIEDEKGKIVRYLGIKENGADNQIAHQIMIASESIIAGVSWTKILSDLRPASQNRE